VPVIGRARALTVFRVERDYARNTISIFCGIRRKTEIFAKKSKKKKSRLRNDDFIFSKRN